MNFVSKIVAAIYRTYDDRGISIPHFRAIITIVIILFLHAVHIGLLFNIPSKWLMPWDADSSKSTQWLFGFLYFGVVIAIILSAFSKEKLDKVEVTQKQMNRAKTILPIYLTLCILLLAILLINSGIEKGKFNW
jgi:uncharacterized membrane protein YagU involved in acid resistance